MPGRSAGLADGEAQYDGLEQRLAAAPAVAAPTTIPMNSAAAGLRRD